MEDQQPKKKRKYDGKKIGELHNQICALCDAKGGLRSLNVYQRDPQITRMINKLEKLHKKLYATLQEFEEPENPTYDLP